EGRSGSRHHHPAKRSAWALQVRRSSAASEPQGWDRSLSCSWCKSLVAHSAPNGGIPGRIARRDGCRLALWRLSRPGNGAERIREGNALVQHEVRNLHLVL